MIKTEKPQEFIINDTGNDKDIKYLDNVAKHLFKNDTYKDVAVRSDINKNEILVISLLRGINTNLKFKSIDNWTIDLLRLRFSKERKSRSELTETMSNIFSRMNDAINQGFNNLQNGMNNFNKRI